MRVSTSLNVLYGPQYTVEEAIRRCRKAGYTSLDFNYWDHQKAVLGLTWQEEEAWAHQIRAVADEVGASFNQMHGPVHGTNFVEMVQGLNEESFLALAERSLRTAAILGLPWAVFHATRVTTRLESVKDRLKHNAAFYRKLLPVMEETGVGIALENLVDKGGEPNGMPRRNYCSTPEELVELIDTLNHPLFGACWDTGHANRQGLHQSAIRELGKRLKVTHINDNDGKEDLHMLPYTGTIDWKEVMTSLDAIGYEGDFTYEAHRSIKRLPDEMRDSGLRYSFELAGYLVASMGDKAVKSLSAAAKENQ
jgi:L-ribulose-5-phosphate 3-epimerase